MLMPIPVSRYHIVRVLLPIHIFIQVPDVNLKFNVTYVTYHAGYMISTTITTYLPTYYILGTYIVHNSKQIQYLKGRT